jgi:SAM-dependent methyltransferase
MDISENERRQIYHSVINEYNTTPLATRHGFKYAPDEMKFREISECLAALPSRDSVFLDIGTGMGIAPRFFKKIGCRCITVDNPLTGGEAASNAALAGIETITADILQVPLPLVDASVDCILFADVIEHLLHSPKRAIEEFRRVLKIGGVVVASTPNALRLSARIRLAIGYSNWPALTDFYDAAYHAGHHHEYTASEFRYSFETLGFDVENVILGGTVATVAVPSMSSLQSRYRGKDIETHPLIKLAKMPIWLLERAVPNFRPSMILVARKTNLADLDRGLGGQQLLSNVH